MSVPSVRFHPFKTLLPILVVFAAMLLVYLNEQRVLDWIKLYGYTPPSSVSALARDDTMTPYAEHLFYVNKPLISSGSVFTSQCPVGSEQTVILGCYLSPDKGIYLYEVTDSRLDGVVQVTAAHEMLHAAYARLSSSERVKVNKMLNAFYKNNLRDNRIEKTIEQYKKTEPGQLQNEMHSVFATEVDLLTPELESYYRQYFTDRAKVVAYTNAYEAEFTSRQDSIKNYDTQLERLKATIEQNQSTITGLRESLSAQLSEMNALRARQDIQAYNQRVVSYNAAVKSYNTLLEQTRADIRTYNQIIDKRNAIVLEEQQLAQALSAQSLPSAP